MNLTPIDEIREKGWCATFKRLWSLQIAVFWSCMSGLFFIWPHLTEAMPTRYWAAGGFVIATSIALARVLKQPGSEGL